MTIRLYKTNSTPYSDKKSENFLIEKKSKNKKTRACF